MAKKAANILKYTLSTALAVVLVWFAFRGVDWKAFWEGVQQTRWVWVALYFVAAILALTWATSSTWCCPARANSSAAATSPPSG